MCLPRRALIDSSLRLLMRHARWSSRDEIEASGTAVEYYVEVTLDEFGGVLRNCAKARRSRCRFRGDLLVLFLKV